MIDLHTPNGIDANPPYDAVLANLQGNILKSHGREHVCLLFLRFDTAGATPAQVRAWIADFAIRYVTSASRQLEEAKKWDESRQPGGVFGNFFLTAKGYRALGLEPLSEISQSGIAARFGPGMRAAADALGDLPEAWGPPYDADIHAMVLLADDPSPGEVPRAMPARLQQVRDDVRASCVGVVTLAGEEEGAMLHNAAGEAIEHFGFVDGRSQPLFFSADIFKEGGETWKPAAPLELALVPDSWAPGDDCFGSFLVFRKLEQDVKSFFEKESQLAAALQLQDADRERAGALVVGRFRDGTPLAEYATSQPGDPVARRRNDFDYGNESTTGSRCPVHAHIRKVNQRTTDVDLAMEHKSRRIARRSIPYGYREGQEKNPPALEDEPENGVGMLFMCFQASIPEQFAFLQQQWANATKPPLPGLDPLVGRIKDDQSLNQNWPVRWDEEPTQGFDFSGFITLKGGEFFFAPSLPFLLNPPAPPPPPMTA